MADERPLAEQMYPNAVEQAMADQLRTNLPRLRDHFGLTVEESEQMRQLHVSEMRETVTAADSAKIHNLITQFTIKPATDEQSQKWGPESRRIVRETYGDAADKYTAAAQALVRGRPEFDKLISQANLYNNPDLVMA